MRARARVILRIRGRCDSLQSLPRNVGNDRTEAKPTALEDLPRGLENSETARTSKDRFPNLEGPPLVRIRLHDACRVGRYSFEVGLQERAVLGGVVNANSGELAHVLGGALEVV